MRRIEAMLFVAWEAEERFYSELSELFDSHRADHRAHARMGVLAAMCRAHASRLAGRLAPTKAGRLGLVPPLKRELPESLPRALRELSLRFRVAVQRYDLMCQRSREVGGDSGITWACSLNRNEKEDMAKELLTLADWVELIRAMPEETPEPPIALPPFEESLSGLRDMNKKKTPEPA